MIVNGRAFTTETRRHREIWKALASPPYSEYIVVAMTRDEACRLIVEGINYAAYRETDSSLFDADKNRLFGSKEYDSGRIVLGPNPWAEGDFEEKMATLLMWANALNRSLPAFAEAQNLLESEDSVIGRVIRRSKR